VFSEIPLAKGGKTLLNCPKLSGEAIGCYIWYPNERRKKQERNNCLDPGLFL